MPKILIVEDQVLIANHIKEILVENKYLDIELAYKLNQASEKLNDYHPNLILLDINVEGKDSGIIWAQENLKSEKVIFITGQTEIETLKKALTIKPVAYLTKPIKTIDVIAAIELAIEQTKLNFITIKEGYEEIKLPFDDILFIKSDKNYIDIQTSTKMITVRYSLDHFHQELDQNQFIRVHRSYVANKNKITSKSTTSLKINSFEIPVSRTLSFKL
ncbi:LytTR family DNA-binding domain-containing protein [Flavobacterium sp. NRK F7]|uniref:LytR/AlgR family response regulator transcription factor n=1 Tax=Flavobacterium sp. NRK F7 TaxID=2954930 RepID=UPI0020912FCC|nr:LytTR family transcriptional regulator DNA-binding domain-containing protein [Flavobacterium sp. NRK F7]MCO6162057.1 DNA-binding response regulator [Flavobacterium sp. NRK F7]